MSRTTLCAITAGILVTLSIGLMAGRYQVLGKELLVPHDPRTWKVTMKVNGNSLAANARLMTITPVDYDRQHIHHESFHSAELLDKPPSARHPERRQVYWTRRAGVREGPFRAHYEFYCDIGSPTAAPSHLALTLYAPPHPGQYLESEALVESDHADVTALALRLIAGRQGTYDQMEALFQYVDQQVDNEPNVGLSSPGAVECLQHGTGDSRAKSRLLLALCRNRGIPARLVTGLTLARGHEQTAHVWIEAWVRDHWRPLCPFHHHFGRVPATYLVFGFGDLPVVRGRNVHDLDYAFLVERTAPEESAAALEGHGDNRADTSPARRFVKHLCLDSLPPPEQRLVEFLLLLPIAALIVCLYRNVIGIQSFGTFAPALVGLAFRELHSLPGITIFVALVLLGWGMRRLLDRYHLLQVPRTAVMLSLVVIVLIGIVVAANYRELPASRLIPLFPIVILTGMIERFWTLEVEDGTSSSFRTLLGTMLIAASIALVLSIPAVVNHMFHFPETLGIILAGQLLIGRYTGYRLMELYRFRDFMQTASSG